MTMDSKQTNKYEKDIINTGDGICALRDFGKLRRAVA